MLKRVLLAVTLIALCGGPVGCGSSSSAHAQAVTSAPAFSLTAILQWGYDGIVRAQEWVEPDGRMSTQSQLPGESTALNLWPTMSTKPTRDSLAEVTLQRCGWDEPCMERMNWSAMVSETDGGAYRFGVERSGTGQFRPILFCFENVTPGVSYCPMKIDLGGVSVLGADGQYKLIQ